MSSSRSTYSPGAHRLTEREQDILRLVVRSFIETAGPVGSRYLARRYDLGLSPASIRNTMGDLEDLGYLGHPYTSAGRMPTEQGYRTFVDELMAMKELTTADKLLLKARLDQVMGDMENLLRESSRLLGQMSNLLGLVLSPAFSRGVLERLDVAQVSSSRILVVLSVRGGLVRTIQFELDTALKRGDIDHVVAILNERLGGLTLEEIRHTCATRTRDLEDHTGLVRLILDESATIFSEPTEGRIQVGGARQLITQPEFQETAAVRHLIALLEDEGYIVHLLEAVSPEDTGQVLVSIGSENPGEKFGRYSLVTARFGIGETFGTIGVLGPTRMDYGRVVALVEGMAGLLSRPTRGASH